ncbi:phosphoethanolamine transferase [Shewanella algidipiscicola]|uniref:Phosphoethanolamine transferase n=1 Tax=Shewanella algidipiscicola TaxID=614070 RepID=A0ABQ4PN72_9GAMM|nr:phosphoethanolamine--lipid A transferase [Shewanella algidipiscicola]GIU49879.1 phosphoethanolamine transferase [Shewanella algidipiscicola]
MKFFNNRFSTNQFTFLIALFYVAIFNIPLFKLVRQGIAQQGDVNYLFVASLPFFLLFSLSIIFSLFSIKWILKPFFMVLTLLSSTLFFAALEYGVVFDYGMIENTLQTNSSEAFTYLNLDSVVAVIVTGLLPALLIYRMNITHKPFFNELLYKLAFILVMALGIGLIGMLYYQHYVTFGRNNDKIKRYIVPIYAVGSLAKYINSNYLQTPLVYKRQGIDAKNISAGTNQKPNLLVLVVGETARSMNYAYYGYHRATNAHTQPFDIIAFQDMVSCGTATAVSLPCMFSSMDRQSYKAREAQAQDTVLDVLSYAGIKVNWLDNDSGCKGVCDRVEYLKVDMSADNPFCDGHYCYDEVLLAELDKHLGLPVSQDSLIVLHIMGSHGPTYYLRYPDAHRTFIPDCQRSDIQNCSDAELINTYDNTILYSDYILAQVIERLKETQHKVDSALLYVSDHGESLGERGLYLHGTPYAFAPKEQISVPLLAWFSADFAADNQLNIDCLTQFATQGGFSHDNLFSSLLGLMNVTTSLYLPALDLFSSCRVDIDKNSLSATN